MSSSEGSAAHLQDAGLAKRDLFVHLRGAACHQVAHLHEMGARVVSLTSCGLGAPRRSRVASVITAALTSAERASCPETLE